MPGAHSFFARHRGALEPSRLNDAPLASGLPDCHAPTSLAKMGVGAVCQGHRMSLSGLASLSRLLRFFGAVPIALAVWAIPSSAIAAMGATEDTVNNQRPPELYRSHPAEQSDYDLAMRLMRHQQYAEAIPHLQFALADKPTDTELLNDLGYAKRMVGDTDSSLYYYQRALGIDPNNKTAHENLGELDLAKYDLPSAQKEAATLASLCPSGCDERARLDKAIADYRPSGSTAPVASSTPGARN